MVERLNCEQRLPQIATQITEWYHVVRQNIYLKFTFGEVHQPKGCLEFYSSFSRTRCGRSPTRSRLEKKTVTQKKTKKKQNTKQYTRAFWVREFFGSLWSSSCWVLHLAGCFFRCAEKPGRCLLGIFVGKVWQSYIIPDPWKTCEKTQIFSKYQLVRRISSMNKFGGEKSRTFNQWKNYPKTNKLPASSLFFHATQGPLSLLTCFPIFVCRGARGARFASEK